MIKTATINKIEICYDIIGEQNTNTIILISGLGTQMIRWTIPFCEMLADKGFRVVRFDNRDSGGSTFFANEKLPSLLELSDLVKSGECIKVQYTLFDMVEDVIELLNYLSIAKAHLVGRSMGGIIAQLIASQYPGRVLTLTSIMSTSLNPSLPLAKADVMEMMIKPKPNYNYDREAFLSESLAFAKRISGSMFPLNDKDQLAIIEEEVFRSNNQSGLLRQLYAIISVGYKRERFETIESPTLVIHGSEDPIFLPECGKDTAISIGGSEFLLIEGMGHDIPSGLFEIIIDAIIQHVKKIE